MLLSAFKYSIEGAQKLQLISRHRPLFWQQGWDSSRGNNSGGGRHSASNMTSSSRQYNIQHSKRGGGGGPQSSSSGFSNREGIDQVRVSNVTHER